jgi:ankyrin repeat protein
MNHFKSLSSEEVIQSEIMDLQRACRLGDLTAIKAAYFANSEKVNHKDDSLGWTPLYRTVICGHLKACQFLLENNADPNIPNNLGESPLHQAANNSQYQISELLLQYNADPNLQQNEGDTPLHHAAFMGDAKMVEILLKSNADPNIPNFMLGRTPLHSAIDSMHEETIKLLLDYNADPTLQDRQGKTPIDLIPNESFKHYIENYQTNPSSSSSEECKAGTFGKESMAYEFFDSPSLQQNQTLYEPDAETSIIGKKNQLKPLYEWLEKINLQEIYEILCEAGYDDIDSLLNQMKCPLPISLDDLEKIGVKKPGHRYRLLIKLEEDSGIVSKKYIKRYNEGQNFWKCCSIPSNTTYGLFGTISLREWLRTLKLEELVPKFVEAGFDDYEMIMSQMLSRYPITDEVLTNDIKINKPGYRNRILGKLKEDLKNIISKKDQILQIENSSKQTSCDTCTIA